MSVQDVKDEVDKLVAGVKAFLDGQTPDNPPAEQPTVDDLLGHVHSARVAVDAAVANEQNRQGEVARLGGVGADVNPNGPLGVAEGVPVSVDAGVPAEAPQPDVARGPDDV